MSVPASFPGQNGRFNRPRPPVAAVPSSRPPVGVKAATQPELPGATEPVGTIVQEPAPSAFPVPDADIDSDQSDAAAEAVAPVSSGDPTPSPAADLEISPTEKTPVTPPAAAVPEPEAAESAPPKSKRGRSTTRTARKPAGGASEARLVVVQGGVVATDSDSIVVIDLDDAEASEDAYAVVKQLEALRAVGASSLLDDTINTLKELIVAKALA